MSRLDEIIEHAKKHFRRVHPELSHDGYYLDHPERSDTMTAYIEAVEWADRHPDIDWKKWNETEWQSQITQLRARLDEYEKALEEIRDTRWSSEHVNPLKCIARAALEKGRGK